jgi:hypothetical protein
VVEDTREEEVAGSNLADRKARDFGVKGMCVLIPWRVRWSFPSSMVLLEPDQSFTVGSMT